MQQKYPQSKKEGFTMYNSFSGGCLVFAFVMVLLGAIVGTAFVTTGEESSSGSAPLPTVAVISPPDGLCTATVISNPDSATGYQIEINYSGEPLQNVQFEIDSPYTEMYLTINGTRYLIAGESMMPSEPINFTKDDTLVLYYDGRNGRAAESLTLIADTTSVNCTISS